MEQVLFVHRELDVFRIPPRTGAGGCRSGEWRVSDRIFSGRCRVVAQGDALEVRLEDPTSGELFGVAPVPPGQAHIAVEQASDSSRNFVLRLEDAASKRHAFVGISFSERSVAFDFNVAISDHQRQQQRAEEMSKISAAADPLAAAAASSVLPEAAALFRPAADLSLKEGETIKIALKKKDAAAPDSDSFTASISRLAGASGAAAPGGKLMSLAPPPSSQAAAPVQLGGLAPPPAVPAASSSAAQPTAPPPQQQLDDLLGWGSFGAAPAAPAAAAAPASTAAGSHPAPAKEEGWATFD